MTREVTGEEEEMKGPVYIDSYSRAWPGCRPWRAPRRRRGAKWAEEWECTHQCASGLTCAGHSQLSHTDALAVTWLGPPCLLFLCLQAVTLLSSGNRVSGPITPRVM